VLSLLNLSSLIIGLQEGLLIGALKWPYLENPTESLWDESDDNPPKLFWSEDLAVVVVPMAVFEDVVHDDIDEE
jgi:hypothetical protein